MRYSFFKTETRRSGQLIVMLKLRGVVQIQMTKNFQIQNVDGTEKRGSKLTKHPIARKDYLNFERNEIETLNDQPYGASSSKFQSPKSKH
jgi:hypothetical protein